MVNFIYTDLTCPISVVHSIKSELGLDVVYRTDNSIWNVNDAMSLITLPTLKLAVVNSIDEITIMESALLYFMCKPILVTTQSIKLYPILEKVSSFVDYNCNLKDPNNNFISWYRVSGL